jgi:heme a synthase
MQPDLAADRRYARLVFSAAVITLLMIVIGAITRVTESGMGCGTYWLTCNGQIIPAFETIHTVIEFGHRVFALIVGGFAIAVAWRAWKSYRHDSSVFIPAMLSLVFFFTQSGLGGLTVKLSNQWVSVMLHLGNAIILLAGFLVTWVNVRKLGDPEPRARHTQNTTAPISAILAATALSFLVVMVGATTQGTDATKACVGFPLCNGEVWPVNQGPLQVVHMSHRLVAGALGLMILWILYQVRRETALRNAVLLTFATYMAQAAIGASIVLVNDRDWLLAARALHVVGAAATWSMLVIVSGMAWRQLRLFNRVQLGVAPSVTTTS